MHALILEHNSWIILTIEDVLREIGFSSFAVASDPMTANSAAMVEAPDLIVCGAWYRNLDAIESIRTIYADRTTPMVFLSTSPGEVLDVLPQAVVVAKPFLDQALKEGVVRAMSEACSQALKRLTGLRISGQGDRMNQALEPRRAAGAGS